MTTNFICIYCADTIGNVRQKGTCGDTRLAHIDYFLGPGYARADCNMIECAEDYLPFDFLYDLGAGYDIDAMKLGL